MIYNNKPTVITKHNLVQIARIIEMRSKRPYLTYQTSVLSMSPTPASTNNNYWQQLTQHPTDGKRSWLAIQGIDPAMTRIRTWVFAATTRSTNHYTIMAKSPADRQCSKIVYIILLADQEAIDQSAYLHILQLKGFLASFLSIRGQLFNLHYHTFSTMISCTN